LGSVSAASRTTEVCVAEGYLEAATHIVRGKVDRGLW